MSHPVFLAADKKKNIFDLPGYAGCGQRGNVITPIAVKDLVPLPMGSSLFFLPDRYPLAINRASGTLEALHGMVPVAAFIPPGYTGLFTPAYKELPGANILPLFSYTPVVLYKEAFHVPAVRVDHRKNHDICALDKRLLARKIHGFKGTSNRLIRHLAACAQTNFCPNAINFFLEKYECPLPTSPVCNARCLGCISWQPKGSCSATQDRLTFKPSADEVAEIALRHIAAVPEGVVSFGQGCEGEPLMAGRVIKEAITQIRKATPRGTIHMNTNASLTAVLDGLFEVGLDSIRVSMNSAREEFYERYYAPCGYGFNDVIASIKAAKRYKKFVALNYLVMPGFTDTEDEFKALCRLIAATRIDMVQWRNLNYDPLRYFTAIELPVISASLGIRTIIARLRKQFPHLKHGYFNLPKSKW